MKIVAVVLIILYLLLALIGCLDRGCAVQNVSGEENAHEVGDEDSDGDVDVGGDDDIGSVLPFDLPTNWEPANRIEHQCGPQY